MKNAREKFKSRKLLVCLSVQFIATVALFTSFGDFETWVEFTKWNVIFYFGANTLTHVSSAWVAQTKIKHSESD